MFSNVIYCLLMAVNTRHILTLGILLQVITTGNTMNTTIVDNSACNTTKIQQLKSKYCSNVLNSTVIANEKVFSKVFETCALLSEDMLKYEETMVCKEMQDCQFNLVDMLVVCRKVETSIFPKEFNDPVLRKKNLADIEAITERVYLVYYIIIGIPFIVGITANGLLFIIMIRYKSARNDVMLVNLVIADILTLTINLPMSVIMEYYEFAGFFEIYNFSSRLCIFVSVYSLVIMSIERFRAVTNKTRIRKNKFRNWIKIACLWVLGSLYVSLHVFTANDFSEKKKIFHNLEARIKLMYVSIVIESTLPAILITVFSVLTSHRLNELTKNFPGELNHHLKRIEDRYLAAKTLIALTILSLISYVPWNIVALVLLNYYPTLERLIVDSIFLHYSTWICISLFTNIMIYLNSALNPFVLYFLSSKFRRYFKSSLSCKTHDIK